MDINKMNSMMEKLKEAVELAQGKVTELSAREDEIQRVDYKKAYKEGGNGISD